MKKAEKISKEIRSWKEEMMWLVSDGHLLEKRREEGEDEKREAALSNILSISGHHFCCRMSYKWIVNMTHCSNLLRILVDSQIKIYGKRHQIFPTMCFYSLLKLFGYMKQKDASVRDNLRSNDKNILN